MLKTVNHKICIVGAGPGGVFTALNLSRLGISCTLIDKSVFPRDKVCGEALPSAVMFSLYKYNPEILKSSEFEKAKQVINGVKVYAPNGKSIYIPYLSKGNAAIGLDSSIGIKRYEFDNLLLNFAKKEKNITVLENLEIKRIEKKEFGYSLYNTDESLCIETQLVVVANGFNSFLTKQLVDWKLDKENNASGITSYYKNVEGISNGNMAECYFLNNLKSGGLYIQPVGDGIVNVNISIHNYVRKKYNLNLRKVLYDALQTNPILEKRFKNAIEIRKPIGYGYHLGIEKRKVCGDNFLLIGDAAGFNDALTANGIGFAIKSAEIAVQTIELAYLQNDFSEKKLKKYEREVFKQFKSVRIVGRVGTWLMKYPNLIFITINTFFGNKLFEEFAYEALYTKYPWTLVFKMPIIWFFRIFKKT